MKIKVLAWVLIAALIVGGVYIGIAWIRHIRSPAADTTSPTFAGNVINDGKTFGCTLSLSPGVHDNRAVEKVEYYLDSSLLYVTYVSPFKADISLVDIKDGSHVLKLVAYDAAGNKTSLQRSVVVQKSDAHCPGVTKEPSTSEPAAPPLPSTPTPPTNTSKKSSQNSSGQQSGGNNSPIPTTDTQAPTNPTNLLVSFDSVGHRNELTWNGSTDNNAVTGYKIIRDGGVIATVTTTHYTDTLIGDGQTYGYAIKAVDAANNLSGPSNQVVIMLPAHTIWDGANPTLDATDATPFEGGIKFIPQVNGQITGVRFYKGPGNDGPHIGTLWDYDDIALDGTQLATITFTDETSSGWQTAYFASPVNVVKDKIYVVSVYFPVGHGSFTPTFYDTVHNTGYLSAPSFAGENGMTWSGTHSFPHNPFSDNSAYGIDVTFALPTPT